ncbi:MAG: adenosylmethionine decarboxylase [Chloroflexi bacterium]|nr:adenosylmethionine decarboxylase [Chloroflexota bacterium]
MNVIGTHLLLELRECNREALDDLPYIREALINAAKEIGATIVGHTFHKFSPYGVTGVVSIAESHLCIHTWPEYSYAAVDIFTCGDTFQPQRAAQLITDSLQSKEHSALEIKRGPLAHASVPQV